jgi:hypothetical protein
LQVVGTMHFIAPSPHTKVIKTKKNYKWQHICMTKEGNENYKYQGEYVHLSFKKTLKMMTLRFLKV